MNKILISIQPKYVCDIVYEIKTLEIRKTRPISEYIKSNLEVKK